ncbi:MAG: short chain dehydrogenase [Actinomycetota bacterium]
MSSLVIDSLGRPQRILLIGGTSEIGLAIVSSLSTATTEVVLAGRDAVRMAAAAGALADCSAGVQVFEMDVTD